MNFKELKELIEIVSSNGEIAELEVERSGTRLRIKRSTNHGASSLRAESQAAQESADEAVPSSPVPAAEESEAFIVTSPMVGTFYRAPSSDADPFVQIGDFVEKGSVVCIIEAMKLMNEIESDVAGEILSISVENGLPVEYGEQLFAIRPR